MVIWLDFVEGVDSYQEEIYKPENRNLFLRRMYRYPINSSNVEISGSFTVEETKDLSGILNAGSFLFILKKSIRLQSAHNSVNKH